MDPVGGVRRSGWLSGVILLGFFALPSLWAAQFAGEPSRESVTLKGRVVEKAGGAPLDGVGVTLLSPKSSTVTGGRGEFVLPGVPEGLRQLIFEKDGYLPVILKVRVQAGGGELFVEAALEAFKKEITVTADQFSGAENIASSRQRLSGAEARRIPGIFEDVSRALQVIPGVASSGDFKNDLIVRGGSPAENLFMIDSIQVPSLSHFGSQNSSGGSIGLLDANLIRDIEFSSGGFPAYYGDKISSVTRVLLREGNRSGVSSRLNLSLFGASGEIEGPLFSSRGSWIFSLRKDYFSVIPSDLTLGLTVIPDFADGQLKLVYDLSPRLQLSAIGLASKDSLNIEEADVPPDQRMKINTGDELGVYGATLKALLGADGVAYFTLARTTDRYSYSRFSHGLERNTIRAEDRDVTVRADGEFYLFSKLQILTGLSVKALEAAHHVYYSGGYIVIDRMGFQFTKKNADAHLASDKEAFYVQASYPLTARLKATAGARGDYFRYIRGFSLGPRVGLSYAVLPGSEVRLSYGVYTQAPETFWLDSDPANRDLPFLRAEHVTLGLEHKLRPDLRAKVEVYAKTYRNYPVDKSNPYLTLADEGGSVIPTYFGSRLLGVGTGFARGVEVSLEKALSGRFSWLVDYSYSVVKYKALDGVLRPGDYDFRHIVNAVLSYRPTASFDVSLRWRFAGGQPYTPFDLRLSESKNTSYFDLTKINTLRYPPYHRLDLRLEKRFTFKKWALAVSLDLENVYNRRNIYYIFWEDGRQKNVYFLPIIPLVGLQAEF